MTLDSRPSTAGVAPARVGRRRPVAVLLAAVTGIVLLGCALSEAVTAVWAVALIVLVPTARRLDRRIAVNLSLLVGCSPVLIWLPPVIGERTAALTLVALASAISALSILRSGRAVVPAVHRSDCTIVVAALLAMAAASPLRSPANPGSAMRMLTAGWDHASHFSMFVEQRLLLTAPPFLPEAADRSGFFFDQYPQWFHSLLVVMSQLFVGASADVPNELVTYARMQWALYVVLAVLTTAALMQSIPQQTFTPVRISVLVVGLSLVLGVPGALNLMQGHLSFLLATLSAPVIHLLVRGRPSLAAHELAAILGLVVVAASWMLVLPLACVAAGPHVWSAWRAARGLRKVGLACGVAATAVVSSLMIWQSVKESPTEHVVMDGPVAAVGVAATVVVLLGALVVVVGGHVAGAGAWRSATDRVGLMIVLTALAEVVCLGAFQVYATGELSYYFWKVSMAALVVGLLLSAVAAAELVAARQAVLGPPRTIVGVLGAAIVAVVASAGLGVGLQHYPASSLSWAAATREQLQQRALSTSGSGAGVVLRLSGEVTSPSMAARTTLVATAESDLSPAYANQWFHALTRSRTVRAGEIDDDLYVLGLDRSNTAAAAELIERLLSDPDQRVVVTDPALSQRLLRELTPTQMGRVTLVNGAPSSEETP